MADPWYLLGFPLMVGSGEQLFIIDATPGSTEMPTIMIPIRDQDREIGERIVKAHNDAIQVSLTAQEKTVLLMASGMADDMQASEVQEYRRLGTIFKGLLAMMTKYVKVQK